MDDELPLVRTRRIKREQLALFLPSHELIKAFENIAVDVSEMLPEAIATAASSASQEAGSASAQASSALNQIARIADALELLALAPPSTPQPRPDATSDCHLCAALREEVAALAQRVQALELAP